MSILQKRNSNTKNTILQYCMLKGQRVHCKTRYVIIHIDCMPIQTQKGTVKSQKFKVHLEIVV